MSQQYKKILILLLLSQAFYTAFSQNISNLDNNNGFKEFKFGESKSKWANFLSKNNNMPNTYNYTGTCCNTAFGEVSNVILRFNDQDKLSQIAVVIRDRQQADGQRKFYNSLVSAFGKPNSTETEGNTGNISFQWVGKKVVLSCINTYKGAAEGGWEIFLLFDLESNTISPAKDY